MHSKMFNSETLITLDREGSAFSRMQTPRTLYAAIDARHRICDDRLMDHTLIKQSTFKRLNVDSLTDSFLGNDRSVSQ